MSARELRLLAIRRLADIAGYDERIDPAAVVRRPEAITVLHRKALRAARGDELLRGEVNGLLDVAHGRTTQLIDAVHELGLPEQTPTRADAMSLDEFDRTIEEALR